MLESIYSRLKTTFENRRDAFLKVTGIKRYDPPEELKTENVEGVITATNDMTTTAAENNVREEQHATNKKVNLLLSMARDNHGATAPRLTQCANYLRYVDGALYEADADDVQDSDGMLLAGIRRVDL